MQNKFLCIQLIPCPRSGWKILLGNEMNLFTYIFFNKQTCTQFLKAGGSKREVNPQFKCDSKDTLKHKGAPLS